MPSGFNPAAASCAEVLLTCNHNCMTDNQAVTLTSSASTKSLGESPHNMGCARVKQQRPNSTSQGTISRASAFGPAALLLLLLLELHAVLPAALLSMLLLQPKRGCCSFCSYNHAAGGPRLPILKLEPACTVFSRLHISPNSCCCWGLPAGAVRPASTGTPLYDANILEHHPLAQPLPTAAAASCSTVAPG
jgi:hypothetical protein